MLRILKNNKAQAVAGEYVLVLFLVVGAFSAMSLYVRRAMQAKIYDARNSMFQTINGEMTADARNMMVGNLYLEYEPYYASTQSEIERDNETITTLKPGGSTGIFQQDHDDYTRVETFSVTAPPKYGD